MSSLFPSLTTTAQRIVNQDQATELKKKQALSPLFIAPKKVEQPKPTLKQRAAEYLTKPQDIPTAPIATALFPALGPATLLSPKIKDVQGGIVGAAARAVPGSLAKASIRTALELSPEGKAAREAGTQGPSIKVTDPLAKALVGEGDITTLSSGPVATKTRQFLEEQGVERKTAASAGLFPSLALMAFTENPFQFGAGKAAKETAEQIAKKVGEEVAPKVASEILTKATEEIGIPVYRGGGFDLQKITDLGVSVSRDKRIANTFDPVRGNLGTGKSEDLIISPAAKIAKTEDIPKELLTRLNEQGTEGEQAVVNWGKENGYDALDFGEVTGVDEIRVINPEVLKPKSAFQELKQGEQAIDTSKLPKIEQTRIGAGKAAKETAEQIAKRAAKEAGEEILPKVGKDLTPEIETLAKQSKSAEEFVKAHDPRLDLKISSPLTIDKTPYIVKDIFTNGAGNKSVTVSNKLTGRELTMPLRDLPEDSVTKPTFISSEIFFGKGAKIKLRGNAPTYQPSIDYLKDQIKSGARPKVSISDNQYGKGLTVSDGNHTLEAYRQLGVKDIPIIDYSEGKKAIKFETKEMPIVETAVQDVLDTSKLPKIEQVRITENPELGTIDKIEELRSRTRGVVTDVEAQDVAKNLGYDTQKVLDLPVGTALTKEEQYAVTGIVNNSRDVLKNYEARLPEIKEGLSSIDEAVKSKAVSEMEDYTRRKIQHMKLLEVERGTRAEAGRALQAHKATVDSITEGEQRLSKFLSGLKNTPDDIAKKEYVYDIIGKFDGDSKEMDDLLKKLNESTAMEKFVEFATAIKLTAIPTHLTNMITSALRVAADVPLRGVSGILDSSIGRIWGGNKTRFVREMGAEASGQWAGWKTGWGDVLEAIKNEDFKSSSPLVKDAMAKGPAIKGRLGKDTAYDNFLDWLGPKVRAPFRLLGVEDMILRKPAYMGDMFVQAERSALQKGLKPGTEEYIKTVSSYIENPTLRSIDEATEKASVSLFQKEPGPLTQKLNNIRNEFPSSKLVLPFMNGVANLIKQGIEFTPFAPILKDTRTALKTRGPAMDALAKMTLGTAAMIPISQYAMEGNITLEAPKDAAERDAWYASGKQPYSIKFGDKWYPYGRFSPFADTITYAALLGKAAKDDDKQGFATNLRAAAVGMMTNVLDKSFVQGLSDMLNALTDPSKGEKWWQNLATGSLVPTIVSRAAQANDPVVREANNLKEAFMAKLPGLSDNLKAKLDVFGEDVVRPGTPLQRFISPSVPSEAQIDVVRKELENLDVKLSFPSKKAFGQELSAEQYHELKTISGKVTYTVLNNLVTNPEFQKLPFQDRQKAVETTISKVREAARTKVAPEFAIQKRIQELVKKKGPSLTDEQVKQMSDQVYTTMQLNKLKQTQ